MSECAFCDGAASIEAYQKESTADEIYALLALFKICVKHAQELDKINSERDARDSVRG